ncbi:DinB family protein [Streptomyces sp. NPDC059070]|uniref:DinB family protein n=1 Tax=Streptomyces sp. NPDC059070 TaxID=3346713 RepID=UPI0036C05CA5
MSTRPRESAPTGPARANRRRRDTPPPRTGGGEAEVLRGFLDYVRESVAAKVEDAPEPEVRTAAVPSGTNLLGLLSHLTFVERAVFLGEEDVDWQTTFRAAPGESVSDVVARYRAAVEQANEVLDACPDLSAPVPRNHSNRRSPSVRWALTHLIEETARHAGHADIVRELIDGATGR